MMWKTTWRGVSCAVTNAIQSRTLVSSSRTRWLPAASTSERHCHSFSFASSNSSAFPASSLMGLVAGGLAFASLAAINDGSATALNETPAPSSIDALTSTSFSDEDKPEGTKRHLRSRRRHRDEVELMQRYLDEYKRVQQETNSLRSQFDLFASQLAADKKTKLMTFTDFVHSIVLPRFRLNDPSPELVYKCEFVGDANGLISFEECYVLLHLLQIPPIHFDVAFCMFDLDGNGTVDKTEFCDVIETLLKSLAIQNHEEFVNVSVEKLLYRLTRYLFGRYGNKKITADDLKKVLNSLRQQLLRAEFDLYAKPHPVKTSIQVLSVHDFAITLISCFDPNHLPPFMQRCQELQDSKELVTWEDFLDFHFHVENKLEDIETTFELMGTKEITESQFLRAARVVTGIELSHSVVQWAFRVFDTDGNGSLNRNELLKILGMRGNIELHEKHPDSRFKQFWNCVKRDNNNK